MNLSTCVAGISGTRWNQGPMTHFGSCDTGSRWMVLGTLDFGLVWQNYFCGGLAQSRVPGFSGILWRVCSCSPSTTQRVWTVRSVHRVSTGPMEFQWRRSMAASVSLMSIPCIWQAVCITPRVSQARGPGRSLLPCLRSIGSISF